MATIVSYSKGLKRIEWSVAKGQPRRIIRLGRVNMKVAEGWCAKVEAILADQLANRPHDSEVSKWLGGLDEVMLSRMRTAGLAEGVGLAHVTLEAFLSRYFSSLIGKSATRTFYSHTRRNLEAFFGTGRLLRTITPADADAFRAWLVEHTETAADGTIGIRRLSPSTVGRRIIAARTMWRQAVRWKLASENPFTGVKGGHQSNEARKAFVSHDVIDAVIAEAPDDEWKAIIALARYGGLRCPSEHFALRWADVDFDAGRITVRSPKTEHHEGHEYRIIPLFPELREHLWNLFTQSAAEGAVHVISRHRLGGLNLLANSLGIEAGRAGVAGA